MKILLKKEVCKSHEQDPLPDFKCTSPKKRIKKRKKKEARCRCRHAWEKRNPNVPYSDICN